MDRTCKKCNETKPIEEFPTKKDSRSGKLRPSHGCLDCKRAYGKSYHKKRNETDPEFKAKKNAQAQAWVKANPEGRAAIAKRRNKKAYAENPEKIRCRALVYQRVKHGRMPRVNTLKCSDCGEQAAHYHHHNGYAFEHRYDVIPMCVKCHKD